MYVGFEQKINEYKNDVDYIVIDLTEDVEEFAQESVYKIKSEDIIEFIEDNNMNNDTIGVLYTTRYPSDNYCTLYCYY